MITYNLAPIPLWCLRDNLGEPLENGYMKAYRDTVRSQFKAVYSNAAGTSVYLQPIVFNAAGFQGPFYWASDENYYLEIYDFNNNLIRTIPAYNAPQDGGNTPVTNNIDFTNYIIDPQFTYPIKYLFDPLAVFEYIGISSWQFSKSNTTATDRILIQNFTPGTSTPPNNPLSYFTYECTVSGSGETYKDLEYVFDKVASFQNREMTIAFWAQCGTVANTVEVLFIQNFGTGGSSSAEVVTSVTTFNLTGAWAQYSISAIPPTITGKTLGTNSDDYLKVIFRFPLDAVTTIDMTNFQINDGNQLLSFNYLPPINSEPLQYRLNRTAFEANSALVSLGSVFNVLPLTPTVDAYGWISGNKFQPTFRCQIVATAYYEVGTSSGGVDTEIAVYFNGVTQIAAASYPLEQAGSSGQITLPIAIGFNGTTDYIEFQGRFSGTGVAGAQLILCYIQIL